ncbi:unnamed protein product [Gongylonema pulchrum]|uniref:Glutathione S-transferase omega n=1 Tax=Gongylonema pulchrum TaxID=637853 RepID=A0A183EP93_9BILA|nr:unnamed protein product [Gongylonema pulchrum]
MNEVRHTEYQTVYESAVIAEYLDDIFPETAILPHHPLAKANQKMLVERLSPLISTMFKVLHPNNASVQRDVDKSLHNALQNAEKLLIDDFYGGDHHEFTLGGTMGYADIMIWPFLERLQLVTLNPYTQFRYCWIGIFVGESLQLHKTKKEDASLFSLNVLEAGMEKRIVGN